MNKRGSVLMLALWGLSFLSIVAATLSFNASQEIFMMKREMEGFKRRADFSSVLYEAAEKIQEDPEPHQDSKQKPWYGDLKLDEPLGSRLTVRIEDEESKLNINYASETLLADFFKKFEEEVSPLKGSRKDYVKAISKLRYEKRIDSLEELLLLEDFKKEDLEILRPYLTVYTQFPLINPNTASPLVLSALVESLSGDHGAKQILTGRLEEACRPHGCLFFNEELNPEMFMEKMKLPKTPLMTQVVQNFLVSITTDSETFHIVMKSRDKAQASGIFACRVGQPRPEVFWWHENS